MKEVLIPDTLLRKNMPMPEAIQVAFGLPTLTIAHGPTLKVTSWRSDKRHETIQHRQIRYSMPVGQIPPAIRKFFCGEQLRITSRQHMDTQASTVNVHNKIRMHFLGAEMFHVKPSFQLRKADDGDIYLSGRVEHHAILPPPLCHIAESFMALNSERELKKYGDAMLEVMGKKHPTAQTP